MLCRRLSHGISSSRNRLQLRLVDASNSHPVFGAVTAHSVP